jgi:hypothetical protein
VDFSAKFKLSLNPTFSAGAEDITDSYAGVPLPTLYSGDRDQSKMGESPHVITLNCYSIVT